MDVSAGTIISRTARASKALFLPLTAMTALSAAPVLVLNFVEPFDKPAGVGRAMIVVISTAWVWIVGNIISAATAVIAARRDAGDDVKPGQAVGLVLERSGAICGALLLIAVRLLPWGAALAVVNFAVIPALSDQEYMFPLYAAGTTLLTVAAAVPTLLKYALCSAVVVMEHADASTALRRSAEITKGRRWPVFASACVFLGVQFEVGFFGARLLGLDRSVPAWGLLFLTFGPLAPAALGIAYLEIRSAKEGIGTKEMPKVLG